MEMIYSTRVKGFNDVVTKRDYITQGNGWSQTITTYTISEKDFKNISEVLNVLNKKKNNRKKFLGIF